MKTKLFKGLFAAVACISYLLSFGVFAPSAQAQTSVTLQFQNKTGAQVQVYWINFQNQPKLYRRLGPGQSYNQVTAPNHRWAVYQNGRQIKVHAATRQPYQYIAITNVAARSPSVNVNGLNLRMVDYGTGAFVQTGVKVWHEVSKSNWRLASRFKETLRNQSVVQLYDSSRKMYLSLNLSTRKVYFTTLGKNWQPLYNIRATAAQSRIPGSRIAWDGGRTRGSGGVSVDTAVNVAKGAYGTAQGVKGVRDGRREIADIRAGKAKTNPNAPKTKWGKAKRFGKTRGKNFGKGVLTSPPSSVPFSNGLTLATADADICWKDSYGRGVGVVPKRCAAGQDRIGLLCYQKCGPGKKRFGFDCHSVCPRGWSNQGLFCRRSEYGRGAGYPWKIGDTPFSLNGARARCRRDNPRGCEKYGEIIYPKCKPGYSNFGCCICRPKVPNCRAWGLNPGIDLSCAKKVVIGRPQTGICGSGEEKDAGLCYPRCNAGYTGIGPVCWAQRCPAKYPVNCGASCAVSRNKCIESVANQVSGPLDVVTSIAGLVLTGGAANAAKTAAKTAIKTGVKAGAKAAAKASTRAAIKAQLRARARAMGKELSESVLDNAAETMYEASQTGAFDFADLDPTGIASVVNAYNKPLCAAVK